MKGPKTFIFIAETPLILSKSPVITIRQSMVSVPPLRGRLGGG